MASPNEVVDQAVFQRAWNRVKSTEERLFQQPTHLFSLRPYDLGCVFANRRAIHINMEIRANKDFHHAISLAFSAIAVASSSLIDWRISLVLALLFGIASAVVYIKGRKLHAESKFFFDSAMWAAGVIQFQRELVQGTPWTVSVDGEPQHEHDEPFEVQFKNDAEPNS